MNGGAKWFVFETTAKQNKFIQEKINRFTPKVDQIKNEVAGNVDVTSILINSNSLRFNKVEEIVRSLNGRLRVDYLLTAEIKDNNNGNFHILGGHKLEDHVSGQLVDFAHRQGLDYILGQRVIGPNGEIDIIFITNDVSVSLEEKLLQYLITCDNYFVYSDKNWT
ncbi:MAG TPA: hypothetical protein VMT57_09540 [Candidatus Thermoplasmatota archaeon]|nr:hypothetical protein [Candidatus Thermoplasmatota archaeon]